MKSKADADIKALKAAVRALNCSSSRRMLRANLVFLCDYYLHHPSSKLPRRLKETP